MLVDSSKAFFNMYEGRSMESHKQVAGRAATQVVSRRKELSSCQTTSLCVHRVPVQRRGTTQSFCLHPPALSSTQQHNSFGGGISCPARYSWSPITSLQRVQYCREGKLKWYSSVNNPAAHCTYTMGFLTERETISQGPAAHLPHDEEEPTQRVNFYGCRLIHLIPRLTKTVPECRSIPRVFLSEHFRVKKKILTVVKALKCLWNQSL